MSGRVLARKEQGQLLTQPLFQLADPLSRQVVGGPDDIERARLSDGVDPMSK
jgi:hypothetical protein